MSTPTLRTLAKELGLSRTTISEALRGSPRVKAQTVERVRAAAQKAGYTRNPLTGAVMSQLRRSRGQQFRGVLAVLELVPPNQPVHAARYSAALMEGMKDRAGVLGFKIERFELGTKGLKAQRLDTILLTRGIQGVLLLPASGFPDLSELSWDRYAAVYVDYYIDHPPLHCVCSDHYRSMVSLMQELHARGYRRPGLIMETAIDARLHYRWEGAFLAMQAMLPDLESVPILRRERLTPEDFAKWFNRYKPDVTLGHLPAAMDWMLNCKAAPSEKHSFVCLNSLRTEGNCAAMDFQPHLLGARAAELVIGQLLHNEFGVPENASLATIPAKLIEGPTLRGPVSRLS
jgi:LacI family transcriptional regulator